MASSFHHSLFNAGVSGTPDAFMDEFPAPYQEMGPVIPWTQFQNQFGDNREQPWKRIISRTSGTPLAPSQTLDAFPAPYLAT